MSTPKAFLNDHETKVDLLNNEAIARTIVTLLRERPDRPVTIGVHGDWGAGKSSILEMVEWSLSLDEKVLCLKFNGWRFQGFEDAKIALLEGIVNGLVEKKGLVAKVGDQAKDLFRRIDWLKVAKKTGGLALTALTGLPSPELIADLVTKVASFVADPTGAVNADSAKAAVKELDGLLKPATESKNVPAEVEEFRKSFDKLLEDAGIDQLVVLVDDLDRCLPDTAIETLEAIRLFVFTSRTAFVIAADEAMIEYSVKKHFPDLPESTGPASYSRNYLEKLIQVPFRIPALGESETRIYVSLVLAGSVLGEESKEFLNLIEHARECLRRPWVGKGLERDAIKKALGDRFEEASDVLALSDRIGPVLARGTKGNPRQVKRFLNAMILRIRTAEARGFGEDISLPALAKLMLAERFSAALFEDVARQAGMDAAGRSALVNLLEGGAPAKPGKDAVKKSPFAGQAKERADWERDEWAAEWGKLEPKLHATDLRPYLFVSKDRRDFLGAGAGLGHLAPLAGKLMGTQLGIASAESEIKALQPTEARALFDEISGKVLSADLRLAPSGVEGLRALVRHHPALQESLIDFLRSLPVAELGAWVVGGWNDPVSGEPDGLRALLEKWSTNEESAFLAQAASEALKVGRKN